MPSTASRSAKNCACLAMLSVPFTPAEFVHGGVTDLAFDGNAVVEHREPEREAFVVVS